MAVGFLAVWRWLPAYLPEEGKWSNLKRMLACLAVSVCLWLSLAAIVIAISPGKDVNSIDTIVTAGYCAFAAHVTIGLIVCLRPLPPNGPPTKTPVRIHLLRGSGAAIATGIAILMSKIGDVIAGFASSFPILFAITMISLWSAKKSGLAITATGPMMLGSSSISFFAIVFALLVTRGTRELEPGVDGSDGNGDPDSLDNELHSMNPLVAAVITWCLALCVISMPSFFFLRWRRSLSPAAPAAAPAATVVTDVPAKVEMLGAEGGLASQAANVYVATDAIHVNSHASQQQQLALQDRLRTKTLSMLTTTTTTQAGAEDLVKPAAVTEAAQPTSSSASVDVEWGSSSSPGSTDSNPQPTTASPAVVPAGVGAAVDEWAPSADNNTPIQGTNGAAFDGAHPIAVGGAGSSSNDDEWR